MEVEAKEREESLISVEDKISRGDWCLEVFAHSSLSPAYCAHCAFESDPWFWPGKLASSCVLSPVPARISQSDFLHCWSRQKHPSPAVGFISLCCQIAVVMRVWKAQGLPSPSWHTGCHSHPQKHTGLVGRCWNMTYHVRLPFCGIAVFCLAK